jgi:hypothetical protein
LVGQRVFALALGYEDLIDHDELRHDPTMAVLAGKLSARRKDCAPLAGKSTLNRLERGGPELTRYHRIAWDGARIEALFVDLFVVSTVCSISSGVRLSAKQSANRSTSRIARSVAPSSKPPASEVILPPSNPATTARPSTRANPNRSALHSVCIGSPPSSETNLWCNTIFSDPGPRCTYPL